jgi:Uncharacterized membrane protein, possible Na+ channel or pump
MLSSLLGTFVNAGTVVLGSIIGLLLKRFIPEKVGKTVMAGIALCVLYIGISGSLSGKNPLIMIISIVIGAVIGELVDFEGRFNRFAEGLEKKFKKEGSESTFAEGVVTASLVFCVGSMAVVGSLRSGLSGDHSMLYAKSLLDMVSAVIFASTLGAGVMLSAVFIFAYQGAIAILAHWVAPYLSATVISEMTCVGSLLIIAIGFNMLGITKLKVMNYLPAIFIPIILCTFM